VACVTVLIIRDEKNLQPRQPLSFGASPLIARLWYAQSDFYRGIAKREAGGGAGPEASAQERPIAAVTLQTDALLLPNADHRLLSANQAVCKRALLAHQGALPEQGFDQIDGEYCCLIAHIECWIQFHDIQ
jgi:hypothetical protein